tara:strand:- start:203 stop:592 length:390 start_codon:yes stop_codon:yes gene_type:complete
MLNNNIDISKSKVGILGVTFKENCPDIRNSKVFDMISEFQNWGAKVVVSDPIADNDDVYSEHNIRLENFEEFEGLNVLIVAVGHQEIINLNLNNFKKCMNWDFKPVFADIKSLYNVNILDDLGYTVFRL